MAQLYNILTVCLCIFTDNFFFSATEFLSVCFHIELEYLPLEVNRGFNFFVFTALILIHQKKPHFSLLFCSWNPLCKFCMVFFTFFPQQSSIFFTLNPKLMPSFAERPHLCLYIHQLFSWMTTGEHANSPLVLFGPI